MTESANLRSRLSLGPRRKAREFALLGVYESLINESADFAAIDANLLKAALLPDAISARKTSITAIRSFTVTSLTE